jgi:hypothetical protein
MNPGGKWLEMHSGGKAWRVGINGWHHHQGRVERRPKRIKIDKSFYYIFSTTFKSRHEKSWTNILLDNKMHHCKEEKDKVLIRLILGIYILD